MFETSLKITHLHCDRSAVTEMHTLKIVRAILARLDYGAYALVSHPTTLDEAYTTQLRKVCEMLDAVVSDVRASGQVDVANAVAAGNELLQRIVRDLITPSKMYIV